MISISKIKLGKTTIKAEVANSFWQKAIGLMFRPSISPNTGMIFDFIHEQKPGMWMAFMNFSIDFIWIDSKMKIIDITENAKPWQMYVFHPKKKARYVLEVPAGFCKNKGIKNGCYVEVM